MLQFIPGFPQRYPTIQEIIQPPRMALMVSPTANPTAIYAPSQTVAIVALHKDSL
jgi:hypothetical protein